MKKKCLVLTALMLVCVLFLQGCLPYLVLQDVYEGVSEGLEDPWNNDWDNDWEFDFPEDEEVPVYTDEVESTAPTGPLLPDEPVERPYEPWLSYTSFHDMEYSRPDADGLITKVNELTEKVDSGASAYEIRVCFEPLYENYVEFSTMSNLSYIRYTLDLEDSYYDTEYTWCEEQSPLVEQAFEKCYTAMAKSDVRHELEETYFGEGFFLYYDTYQVYSNDRVVELMQEESALQTEYMALQSNLTITWNGEETLVEEVLGDESLSYTEYLNALELYYGKYNPISAEIFAKLIRVRKEIAAELGYDSYADFAYEFYYWRDYTPAQAAEYISNIAEDLVPVYEYAYAGGGAGNATSDEVMELLKDTAHRFGGAIAEAYDFMETYDLYDISDSPSKMPGSYMTYLPSYEMPYVYISPTGTMDDFLTATHEFGHFVDAYVNCNTTSSIDCAEIFSQGLEFLVLDVADLSYSQRSALEETKLYDSLSVFISQACYSDFERRAYELPDDQLNAETLNALFLECSERFASSYAGLEDYIAPGWVDIQHFFIAPYYMISYCISNDAALQIYQRELDSGDGLALYMELLGNSADNTVLALLESADAESPFAPGRSEELADFFEDHLG